jgi:hypothetical protein
MLFALCIDNMHRKHQVFRFLDSYTGPLAVDRASVDGTLETADVIRQCRDKITSAFIVLPGAQFF